MQSYTWNILQTGREVKIPELNKDEAKMTTMQRREIRKPIDEEIDILTWLPKSRLNSQVDHSVISARTTTAIRKYRSHRGLGALRAPTSSLRPFGPAFGPSGLLDFVLRALRALRPCDPRNSAFCYALSFEEKSS